MADTFKPDRILTSRGFDIFLELDKADVDKALLRCIAEAIAHLEKRLDDLATLGHPELQLHFKFYEARE